MTIGSAGTGAAPSGEAPDQDLVPPGGESNGDEGDGSDDVVPKTRFIAALKSADAKAQQALERAEAAERRAKELEERVRKDGEKKPPTRTELLSLVNSGDLTQEQADSIWEKQIVEKARREAAAEVSSTLNATERQRVVEGQLRGYRELVSAAWEEGTPERAKVQAEYEHLVNVLGHKPTKETEAAALRAAFGDIDTLRAAKSKARPGPADTHSETGGGGKPAGAGGSKDVLKSLSPREKQHYGRLIDQGIYKNWDAVKAELDHANPEVRRRMGAKA
jgi:hypothetical protein